MDERDVYDPMDARLRELLDWVADDVRRRAVDDDTMVRRVQTGVRRRRSRFGAALRIAAIAAALAAVCTLLVATALLVGSRWQTQVEEAAPFVDDFLSDQAGEALRPGVHAIHGVRPPFTITIPPSDATAWENGGVDDDLVGLIERPTGNRVYIGIGGTPADTGPRICDRRSPGCIGVWPAGSSTEDRFPEYFQTRPLVGLDNGWLLIGAETRANLAEFLPRAEIVIGSIDFRSTAVVSSAPPGSEPVPVPPGLEDIFIGHQGFDRELRFVSPTEAPPTVSPERAVRIARHAYAADLALQGLPLGADEPIAVVRRVTTGPGEPPRPTWAIAFWYPLADGTSMLVIEFVDDQTGVIVGSLSASGLASSMRGGSPLPSGG